MTYEDIYSRFFSKCSDKSLLKLSQEDAYAQLQEYLEDTLSEVYIKKVFNNIDLDDIEMSIEYSLVNSVDEKSDEKFVKDILARGMVIAWMQQKIDSDINLATAIGGKEEKVLKNEYKTNIVRVDSLINQLKKKIRDYGYENGTFENEE